MKENILFEETQKFDQSFFIWAIWLGPLFIASIIVYQVFSGTFSLSETDGKILGGLFILMSLLSMLLQRIQLRTLVTKDKIILTFPYMTTKEVSIESITKAEKKTYSPLKDYGGWGIRWGKEGKAYNVKGNEGIKLLINGREKFMIGSQKADELEQVLKSLSVPI